MKSNPFELCSAAFKFRHGTSMQRIVGKQSEHSESTIWSGLRHYIGRLGSWEKARNILVRVATRHPNLIVSFRLEYLRSPRAVAGPAADSHTHLDGVLRRMLPANESLRHKQVLEAIHDNRVVDLSSDFLKAYNDDTFRSRVHAELLVPEQFHHNSLEFFNHERYVGCSKPSCYCCNLYMKCHPGTFNTRASHGNLWTNWRPSISPGSSAVAFDKHTRDILNEMVKHIRKAALDQILSKMTRRQKLPDSATGISL